MAVPRGISCAATKMRVDGSSTGVGTTWGAGGGCVWLVITNSPAATNRTMPNRINNRLRFITFSPSDTKWLTSKSRSTPTRSIGLTHAESLNSHQVLQPQTLRNHPLEYRSEPILKQVDTILSE